LISEQANHLVSSPTLDHGGGHAYKCLSDPVFQDDRQTSKYIIRQAYLESSKALITHRHPTSIMHFLLIGATGRTGRHVVSEVLSQGHTAVALVRNPASLSPRSGLTIVTGSPLSKPDIKNALSATPSLTPSAAIITLNAVRKTDSPFAAHLSPPRLLADSCANVCQVLDEAGIHRVVMLSSVGVGDSWAPTPWLIKIFLGCTNVKYTLEDHNLVDKEIRLTNMDWTLVRAARLQFDDPNQERTDIKGEVETLGSKGEGMGMSDSVRVSSVARFLVKTVTEGLYIKSAVVIRD
jgi:hypothetical protein